MSLFKSAQLAVKPESPENEVIIYDERPSMGDVVELHQDQEPEFSFKLAPLPGSDAGILEVSEEAEQKHEEESAKKKDLEVADPWDWKGRDILEWAQERCNSLPQHSGRHTSGIERVVSCLQRVDTELSKAIREDHDGKIDIDKFEKARSEIHSGIERLQEAHDKLTGKKKKKTAQIEVEMDGNGWIKVARTPHFNGWTVNVSPLIMRVAQVIVNSVVSSGKDISKMFNDQSKQYDLDKREQAELMQVLEMMNYPIKTDRAYLHGDSVEISHNDFGELTSQYFG